MNLDERTRWLQDQGALGARHIHRPAWRAQGQAGAAVGPGRCGYVLQAIGRNFGFLDSIRRYLTALGFDLQQMDHEDACGQYEINYRHDAALAAADRYQPFKLTAQAVAQHPLWCFPPCPSRWPTRRAVVCTFT